MIISGLLKTTLLDYPQHVAATIFLGGCNFRCPFCHNSDLLEGMDGLFSKEEVLTFLKKRAGILEGVCITGGEPTLHRDLEPFIREIRSLGLLVKLDTNGYRPDVLKDLCNKNLLDYVAMDIKSGRTGYAKAAGVPGLDLSHIEESVDFLMKNTVPCEFRTTVVRELHREDDFREIGSQELPPIFFKAIRILKMSSSRDFHPIARRNFCIFVTFLFRWFPLQRSGV